jgi:hypothetical protein
MPLVLLSFSQTKKLMYLLAKNGYSLRKEKRCMKAKLPCEEFIGWLKMDYRIYAFG